MHKKIFRHAVTKPPFVLVFLMTFRSLSWADTVVPKNVEQVTSSIQDSILQVWTEFVGRVPYLIAGLLVLIFAWIAAAILTRIVQRILRRSELRGSLKKLIIRFVVIGVWLLGLLLSAMVVFPGLTPSKALGALGIASVAIGFAFKDIFENFFAGILLLWRFPFEEGDFIKCQNIMGQVEDVSIRMTKIRLVSGELVVAPNSMLFKNPVEVITDQNRRRITITTGIAYGEDLEQAVSVIDDALNNSKTVDKDREIQVFPKEFGSSSIDIEVTWWTDPMPVDVRRSRGEVITSVKKFLDDASIEIPFPYRTLTFKESLKTELIKEKSG
jgi:small-conductance mechanosensitive channel